jgi:hypothetical protein
MRVASFLAIIAIALAWPVAALAEKGRAKEAAKVYSRAGEKGKIVLKVQEGQVMRVVRKEGRWLKVRVKGRTGWIPRTKIELVEEEQLARNTRRRPFVDGRGTRRGFGGEQGPDDRVGADAVDDDERPKPRAKPRGRGDDDDDDDDDGDTDGDEPLFSEEDDETDPDDDRPRVRVKGEVTVYSEPDDDGEEAEWDVEKGAVLFFMGKKGKFTEVENEEGDLGYILSSRLESIGSVAQSRSAGKATMDASGRLGVTIIQQGMRSNGTGFPDNYNLSTSAATIAVGGTYLRPYGPKYVIGGDANLDIARAIPGIKDPMMGNNVGITLYHLNARGMFGYDLKKPSGMVVFGRLGLRYQSYQVSRELSKNTLKLPSEILTAPTLGGAIAMPRLTDKIGLRFSLDAVLAGASLQQTKNLEDGDNPSAKGVVVGAGLTYRWKPDMDIQATYDFNYTRYDFGTPIPSLREHMATQNLKRTDLFHGVTVGVGKAF